MRRIGQALAVVAVIAALIVSSIAIAADSKGGKRRDGRGPDAALATVAQKLGVSKESLAKAFKSARDANEPTAAERAEMEKRCTAITDAVAKELGKSGDEVRAAAKAVAKEQIEKAVKEGKLTRERADKALAKLDQRSCIPPLPRPGGPRGKAAHNAKRDGQRPLAALAAKLDVSTSKLRAALRSAHESVGRPTEAEREQRRAEMEKRCTTITDAVAKDVGKSGDELRAAIKATAKEKVEKAVEDGKIDRDDADQILKRIDSSSCLPLGGPGHGRGGPGGPGHGHGPGGPGPGAFRDGGPPPGGPFGGPPPGGPGERP